DQRRLVDDLTARDVDQDHAQLHRRQRLTTDQSRRLRRPLTRDDHRVALAEERVQTVGTFEPAEPPARGGSARGAATRADPSPARPGAAAADLPADAPRAHHADGFVLEEKRAVRAMVEAVTLPIARGVVKAAGEVEDASQRVLGHRA